MTREGLLSRMAGRRANAARPCLLAEVLNLSRSSVYYKPRPVSAEDLALMRRIDELHLEYPFAGSRMLRDFLNREGVAIGRRHVATSYRRNLVTSGIGKAAYRGGA